MNLRSFLILSASGGAGHLRAAEALEHAATTLDEPLKARHYDVLDLTSKTFKKIYADSYLSIVNRIPELWGYFYAKSENKPYRKKGLLRLFDNVNYQRYLKFLVSERPDAIVCTHFLPYISVSHAMRKAGVSAPVFAVTTDFDAHQVWVDPIVARYYVHMEESAWQLESRGVPASNIRVKGIPLMPRFIQPPDRTTARRELGLDDEAFTILMMWGGFGVGKGEEMVDRTLRSLEGFPDRSFAVLVVCGKNEKLLKRIAEQTQPPHICLKPYGFVDNVHTMMAASDVMTSKAGGLTSAEAMAMNLPVIIADPIPGQEMRNADIIVEHGAGWKALNIPNLGYKLRRIIEHPELLDKARQATGALARPAAARDILCDIIGFLGDGDKS